MYDVVQWVNESRTKDALPCLQAPVHHSGCSTEEQSSGPCDHVFAILCCGASSEKSRSCQRRHVHAVSRNKASDRDGHLREAPRRALVVVQRVHAEETGCSKGCQPALSDREKVRAHTRAVQRSHAQTTTCVCNLREEVLEARQVVRRSRSRDGRYSWLTLPCLQSGVRQFSRRSCAPIVGNRVFASSRVMVTRESA